MIKNLVLKISKETLENNIALSQALLRSNNQYVGQLNEIVIAYRGLFDLIPYDLQDLGSGKHLPFFEGDLELSSVITLAMQGYYRIAFSTLRNILELSLVSIYFDLNDNANEEIRQWVNSKEDTPFLKTLVNKIFQNRNFSDFQDLKSDVQNIFWELSNYNHMKGIKYSNRRLGSPLGFGTLSFNEKTLKKIFIEIEKTVAMLLALYAIKYPISFLQVPLFKKFGFNRPMGYFLDEDELALWKKIIGVDLSKRIQKFADSNSKALDMQNDILSMPDIANTEIENQYFEMQKDSIMSTGFQNWVSSHGGVFVIATVDDSSEIVDKKKARFDRWEKWSKENSCYNRPLTIEEMFALKSKGKT